MDFYSGVLGLRLVKRTVNFDDPGTYHLYYGDCLGTPGTIMTFFPWEHAARGERGSGFTDATAFSIPAWSTDFWVERLETVDVGEVRRLERFGEEVLAIEDPDGLAIELVTETDQVRTAAGPARHEDIPTEHAIRSFHGVTLDVADPRVSARAHRPLRLRTTPRGRGTSLSTKAGPLR